MELKVWVEGIQRIVCGVNEKTTCQDVVYALAQATGKTGRFTLIERWRNSERLLAPSELPLKVLSKWGEHSSEVQLILQWSPLLKETNKNNSSNLSPLAMSATPLPPHTPTNNTQSRRGESSKPTNSPTTTNTTSNTTTSNVTSSSVCSPPPYREPPAPMIKELPPYREPPPPSSFLLQNNGSNSPSPLTLQYTLRERSSSSVLSSDGGGSSSPISRDTLNYNSQYNSDSSISHNTRTSLGMRNGEMGSYSESPKVSPPNSSPQYRELIRLINLQREKLTSQQAELTKHDAEIMYWESKCKEEERRVEGVRSEMMRLELLSLEHESQVSSLAHLEEESSCLMTQSEQLQSSILLLRQSISSSDTQLIHSKHRIRVLMDEVERLESEMSEREEELSERESATLFEIEKVRTELDVARKETESVSALSASLEHEVKMLESALSEKKSQMERLVGAMKEANLQSLTIHQQSGSEGESSVKNVDLAQFRAGSTRRMIGSPRQLENAAPTTKNPHGVWV